MIPLRNFTLIHFGMQLFQGIGGGGVVAPPEPPAPPIPGGGGGGGSGAFDAHKYRIKKPEEPEWIAPDPDIICISLHHVGAQWGMAVAEVTCSPKPTRQQQLIVAAFIAQHGSP